MPVIAALIYGKVYRRNLHNTSLRLFVCCTYLCFRVCTSRRVAAGSLIGGGSIPINLIVTYGVAVLPAAIAGIALHRVDKAVLHLLHDAHMVT